jgi:DUF1680 family protein
LDERLDGYIAIMAQSQATPGAVSGDGWLDTYTTLICPDHRFGRDGGNLLWQHNLYNSGCLVEAGVHHYRATGKTNLLVIACRQANYMAGVIGPEPRENIVPAHSLAEEAYLKLYVLFAENPQLKEKIPFPVDEAKYLELVKFWLDMRGRHTGRTSYPRYMGEYSQDHVPLTEQNEAVGHAVRAGLLYTGIAEYVNVTGDKDYAATAQRLWESITRRKMHVSGNIGAVHSEEKFGYEYQLPNNAYLETCAGAAMLFFARNMFLRKGEGEYMEILEKVLYNGVLPGVSLKGDNYFYENPLTSGGNIKRWDWHPCPCCPPMFLKVMGELPSYLYSKDDDGIYVNLYTSSEVSFDFNQNKFELKQETRFPWNGRVTLRVKSAPSSLLKIRLRIPSYAKNFSIAVNGTPFSPVNRDSFAILEREWKTGDVISLDLEITPFLVAAHPYVKDDEGKVALQYGPLLYCIEEADNNMAGIVIPEHWHFEKEESKNFPGIIEIVFEDTLYRKVRAVPYYAWGNRTMGKMEVWLPVENFKKSGVPEWGPVLYKPYKGEL